MDVGGGIALEGDVAIPDGPIGIVVFAHGSGSSRHSPCNQYVARMLRRAGLGTMLFDLLTEREERAEQHTRHIRFDIELLAGRLVSARRWLARQGAIALLPVGYFGASTGAAAALVAAGRDPDGIGAIVSRGGRPDLAGPWLDRVTAPTLLIVGGADPDVVDLNRTALVEIRAPAHLEVIPGAGHLFEEPSALDRVAALAGQWFRTYLPTAIGASATP
jgi:putative phosphoribosyl transferase